MDICIGFYQSAAQTVANSNLHTPMRVDVIIYHPQLHPTVTWLACKGKKNILRTWNMYVTPMPFVCQAQSVGLLLVLDGQPQRVEWRSVHPRFKHSPVWVSFVLVTPHWCGRHCVLLQSVLITPQEPQADKPLWYLQPGFHHKTFISDLERNGIVTCRGGAGLPLRPPRAQKDKRDSVAGFEDECVALMIRGVLSSLSCRSAHRWSSLWWRARSNDDFIPVVLKNMILVIGENKIQKVFQMGV